MGLVTLRRSTPLETELYLKAGDETGAVDDQSRETSTEFEGAWQKSTGVAPRC